MSGYVFELEAIYTLSALSWMTADDEAWETVVYAPTHLDTLAGVRRIDGKVCRVYQCDDGLYRACLAHSDIWADARRQAFA